MATAYTPGLKVVEFMEIKKERRLPLEGEVIIKRGDKVKSDTIVARTYLPGNVELVNVANKLGLEAKEIKDFMLKKEGDAVKKDEMIAETRGFMGLFKGACASPKDGTVENISAVTGQVIIREPALPVEVNAYIDGVVDSIIEKEGVVIKTKGTFIQGIFGIGPEVTGELVVVSGSSEEELKTEQINEKLKNKIIVGGSLVTNEVISACIKAGVSGIIAGGIDDSDLRKLLGYDLGVAITGSEEKGITLVITEGFGRIKMAKRTFQLFKKMEGKLASINGATQIRAGVIRPEVIIPLEDLSIKTEKEAGNLDVGMKVACPVRIIRQPYFGFLGKVISLPVELKNLETEAKVRVVEVELEDGKKIILPRANVELIEV